MELTLADICFYGLACSRSRKTSEESIFYSAHLSPFKFLRIQLPKKLMWIKH